MLSILISKASSRLTKTQRKLSVKTTFFFLSPETTYGTASTELNSLLLCRVVTEVDRRSKGIQGEVEPLLAKRGRGKSEKAMNSR